MDSLPGVELADEMKRGGSPYDELRDMGTFPKRSGIIYANLVMWPLFGQTVIKITKIKNVEEVNIQTSSLASEALAAG